MNVARVFAVIEFQMRGDIAVPVTLSYVSDQDVAMDLVMDPLQDMTCRLALELIAQAMDGVKLVQILGSNGSVPQHWRNPTVDQLTSIRFL
jgi:hypothetical protein